MPDRLEYVCKRDLPPLLQGRSARPNNQAIGGTPHAQEADEPQRRGDRGVLEHGGLTDFNPNPAIEKSHFVREGRRTVVV